MTAEPSGSLRLRPAMRLRESRQFARIKAQGRRLVCGCLVANWQELPPGTSAQVGIVTSRKLGNAVARSRARRLLREAFRLHQHDLSKPVALVLIARPSLAGQSWATVERDFLNALRHAKLLKNSP